MSTSEWNARIVLVSGTTWVIDGEASTIRCAVTTTARRRMPASCPSAASNWISTTSPEPSIEPIGLVVPQRRHQVGPDAILTEGSDGESDGVADGRFQLGRQASELVMRRPVDPHARALHADQDAPP
jgi:hypothetical protein